MKSTGKSPGWPLALAALTLVFGGPACSEAIIADLGVCTQDGEQYTLGEQTEAPDGCNRCICQIDGEWSCTEVSCGGVSPLEPASAAQCVYEGKLYEAGERFTSEDGCYTCHCEAPGLVRCPEYSCGSSSGTGVTPELRPDCSLDGTCPDAGERVCDWRGASYGVGEQWTTSDPCQATCACTRELGPVCKAGPACVQPATPIEPACVHQGVSYKVGEQFALEKPCAMTCICRADSGIQCKSGPDCPLTATGFCEYQGERYPVAQAFPSGGTDCNVCVCDVSGKVQCSEIACPGESGSCAMNERLFGQGAELICADGCNRCKCDGQSFQQTTQLSCPVRPRVEPCPSGATPAMKAVPLYVSKDSIAFQIADTGCLADPAAPLELCYDPQGFDTPLDPTNLPRISLMVLTPELIPCSEGTYVPYVFDLSPLREVYRAQYGAEHGAASLSTSGELLEYRF